MSVRRAVPLILAALFAAVPAHAMMGGKGEDKPSTPPASAPGMAPTPRQQAEAWYADAYDGVTKAKQDLDADNKKGAEKKFKKALDRALRATELDSTYYEAWNLAGYSYRKLGKYDSALAAYGRCLRIQPDYAAAREYLGEAYVELNQLDKAREQLTWLERQNDTATEATTLRGAIETWEKAHPAAEAGK